MRRSTITTMMMLVALAIVVGLLAGCADAATLPDSGGGGQLQGEAKPGSSADETAVAVEPEPEPAAPPAAEPVQVPKTTRGTVTRVVDGDTAVITLASGASEKVRFIGIDTPESTTQHEPYGEEASAYTKRVLAGRTVYLETDAELRDRYGRLLAYIWLEQPVSESDAEVRTKMFNARLALDGFAQQMTYPPNVKYVENFAVYVREAREAGRGLWGLGSTSSAPAPSPAPPAPSSGGSAGSGSSGGAAPAYIGNRNTKKFHYPSCSSVGDMNPANKVPLATRQQAVAGGYIPCKRCNP